jgi:2-keto-myo-inositol isomerase
MELLNRREFVALAAAVPILAQPAPSSGPFVCMNQFSSNGADFRTAMEGYARAGIRAVEVWLAKVREFADKESAATARRLLDDLGLKPVSANNHVGIVEPNAARARALDDLKAKAELLRAIGCRQIVTISATTEKYTVDDYRRAADNLREAGEIARAYDVTLILEFSRYFTLANSLSTALALVRAANHPNVRVMLDTWHFWIGVSKFEDLELLRDGELAHVHFEDVPAEPVRELLEQRHRVLPGQGIAPLRRIVDALKRKGYAGPLSVELMDPAFHAMDPYQLALKVRAAVGPLLG